MTISHCSAIISFIETFDLLKLNYVLLQPDISNIYRPIHKPVSPDYTLARSPQTKKTII